MLGRDRLQHLVVRQFLHLGDATQKSIGEERNALLLGIDQGAVLGALADADAQFVLNNSHLEVSRSLLNLTDGGVT